MYASKGQLVTIFVLMKMLFTEGANITNPTELVQQIKVLLKGQYSQHASTNTTTNSDNREAFSLSCKLLNQLDEIPTGYCPYLFDKVTCWPPTPPGTTMELPCVTWPFETTIPGQKVRRTCLSNGSWEYNSSSEAFRAMYSSCTGCETSADGDEVIFKLIEYSRLTALIGYVLSIAALVFAIGIFVALRKLHCRRNSIHLHCFVSFFFRALLCVIETITSLSKTQESTPCNTDPCLLDLGFMENWQCKSFAVLWNFAIISNYSWILVEGLYLHNIIYFSVFQETRITFYVIFGWGTPILIMIPWVYVKLIYDNTSCWIMYCNLKYMWILRAPVGIAVFVNFIFFCLIVRELHIKLSTDNQFSDQNRYRKLAKSTLILIMVLGIHYIIFDIILLITNWDFSGNSMPTILVHGVAVIVNSTLGLAVAYFYCFCNHEVRTELKKRWREWQSMKQKTTSNSHNSTTATCDHMKKPHRIFNSTATLQHSRSLLGLRRKTTALNSCSECQIRLQLLNNQRAMLRPPANGDFLNPEGTSTQCSTVVNSAQNTLTRTTGRRFMAAAGVEAVAGQRTNHLSNCWEDNESLEGSGSNAVSPAFLSISAHDESNSDNFVSCSDTQLPAALRQLYIDANKQEETIFETES